MQLKPFIPLMILCLASIGEAKQPLLDAVDWLDLESARPIECPEEVRAIDSRRDAECLSAPMPLKLFKKHVRRRLAASRKEGPVLSQGWRREGETVGARLLVHSGYFDLLYADGGHLIALVPPPSCLDADVPTAASADNVPTRLSGESPEYPESARVDRANGWVVLEVLIDREGAIRETCVIAQSRVDLGEAAREAIGNWTYTPAQVDGSAAEVSMLVTTSFWLNP